MFFSDSLCGRLHFLHFSTNCVANVHVEMCVYDVKHVHIKQEHTPEVMPFERHFRN